ATSRGVFYYSGNKWESLFSGDSEDVFTFSSINKFSGESIVCTLTSGVMVFTAGKHYFLSAGESGKEFAARYSQFVYVELPEKSSFNGDTPVFSDAFEYSPGIIWLAFSSNSDGEILEFKIDDVKRGHIAAYRFLSETIQQKLG